MGGSAIKTHLAIEVSNLSVRYPDGRLALNDISFLVEVGDSVAVLGANGAGKSTLLLALVGVLPAEGEIRFGEIVLSDKTLRDVRRKVQLVFQDPNDQLFMPLVRDDVAFGPLNFGVPKDQVPQLVDKSLEAVGLSGFGDRAPHNLSLGERKRAAIASVLACEPEVILLDEPSAGLDAPGRRQLFNLLRDFKATKLIATHDLVLAEELCSKAIVLKAGKLITSGPISSLLSNEMLLSDCGLK